MGEEEATMRERLVEVMMRAMATSQGHSDEGNIGMLIDELDRTENNNRIIIRAAATTALDAALDLLETPSEEMVEAAPSLGSWAPTGYGGAMEHTPTLFGGPASVWSAMLATLRSPKI